MAATALRSREVVVGPGTAPRRRAPGARALRRVGGSRWLVARGPAPAARASGSSRRRSAASRRRRWPRRRPSRRRAGTSTRERRAARRRCSCRCAASRSAWLLGVSAGTALAIVSGLFPVGERLVDPLVQMFRTMPALALVPLFILWFGIDERPKVLLVAFAVAFPVYINLYGGDPRRRRAPRRGGPRRSASAAGASSATSCCRARCPRGPRRPALLARDRVDRARRGGADQRDLRHRRAHDERAEPPADRRHPRRAARLLGARAGIGPCSCALSNGGLLSWRHGLRSL